MAVNDGYLRPIPSDADNDDGRLYDPTVADSGGDATATVTGMDVVVALGTVAATGGATGTVTGQAVTVALGTVAATGGATAPVAGLDALVALGTVSADGGAVVEPPGGGGGVWSIRGPSRKRRQVPVVVPKNAVARVAGLDVAAELDRVTATGGATIVVAGMDVTVALGYVSAWSIQNPTDEMLMADTWLLAA